MPEDMTVEGNALNGANVSFTAPTATDDVDPNPTVSCTYDPTGAFYPLGPTSVTCTTEDMYHNSNSAAFVITVEDTTAPVFSAVADMEVEGNTTRGAKVDYAEPTATDVVWGSRK